MLGKKISFTRTVKALLVNGVMVLLGTAMMHPAQAGCGQYEAPNQKMSDWQPSSSASPRFLRTGFMQVADEETPYHIPDITGLWFFKYISKGNEHLGIPDGAMLDGGNTIWFADGNEMTSSGVRAPNTGSICTGTWKYTGEHTYVLNHIGLSWDPVKNVFAGPAFIKQYVVLDKSNDKYTGTVTITQYAADGKTVDVELKGLIKATRVTVDTTHQVF